VSSELSALVIPTYAECMQSKQAEGLRKAERAMRLVEKEFPPDSVDQAHVSMALGLAQWKTAEHAGWAAHHAGAVREHEPDPDGCDVQVSRLLEGDAPRVRGDRDREATLGDNVAAHEEILRGMHSECVCVAIDITSQARAIVIGPPPKGLMWGSIFVLSHWLPTSQRRSPSGI
jgi:hypothetical protein